MGMRKYLAIAVLCLAIIGAAGWYGLRPHHPDALWQIISQQCVPHQQNNDNPAPCSRVNLAEDYTVLKDINGPLQYLLLPVSRISGIESPQLLSPETANFFWLAWQSRHFMVARYGAPIPDNVISLTINSPSGRTQNQLHIHISCLRGDIRDRLNGLAPDISSRWSIVGSLRGDEYLGRRITAEQLARKSPFMMLADEVPGARDHMERYAMAIATLPDGGMALLATERNLLALNFASAERLQDHQCGLLGLPAAEK